MLNEMLLLEVRAHESMAAEGCKERPAPDLVSRVRGYLEMRIHGEWMEISEFLVALLSQFKLDCRIYNGKNGRTPYENLYIL